jgi:hypothetical protein
MPPKKSPEERSEVLERAQARAKRGYRLKTKTDRKGVTENEIVVIKDMLVSLKLVGYSNEQCAATVGLSRRQVKEIVGHPNFQRRLETLRTKLPEAAINLGRAYLVESVQAVAHVLRTEKDSALVLKAAAEMFDRFGIPKVSRTEAKTDPTPPENNDELSEDVMDKLRRAKPETQEKIAALQESFSEGVERLLNEGSEDGPAE